MPTFDPSPYMMKLKGKDYLPVAARIAWMRAEHPDWGIVTEEVMVDLDSKQARFRATIIDDSGKVIATATKCEDVHGFADYIEKAETGSIGRALALCGYGTLQCQELDEGERLADAPVHRNASAPVRGGMGPGPSNGQVERYQAFQQAGGRGVPVERPITPRSGELATEAQKAKLAELNRRFDANTTKRQASELISQGMAELDDPFADEPHPTEGR